MRKVDKIVIHCSDSPDSRTDIDAREIRCWHVKQGWNDIGYHYVITRKGQLEKGRDESCKGAHVNGHNDHSIGICLVGRNTFTLEQMEILNALVNGLVFKYGLTKANVYGHCELDCRKTCPNINMDKFRDKLIK